MGLRMSQTVRLVGFAGLAALVSGGTPADSRATGASPDRARKVRAEGFRYPKENVGYKYTVLGVADLTGKAPTAWDISGHRDAYLTRLVAEALQRDGAPTAKTVPGRKNRYLIVSLTVHFSPRADPVVADRIEDDTAYANCIQLSSFRDGDSLTSPRTTVTAMPFSAAADRSSASFFLLRTLKLPETKPFRLFPGEGASLQDRSVVFARADKGAPHEIPDITAKEGSWWSLEFDCVQPKDDPAEYYLTALGSDGKAIVCTDQDGTPVSSKVLAASRAAEASGGRLDPRRPLGNRFRMPLPGGSVAQDGKIRVLCSVDPVRIAEIRVDAYVREEVEIAGIPLDPDGVRP
ncbi:MAG: hypothetical protein JST30_05890 [Armatimonadetes bacterium]|nr:hypothetical protein [Armatimonadota bacterium]